MVPCRVLQEHSSAIDVSLHGRLSVYDKETGDYGDGFSSAERFLTQARLMSQRLR